MKVVHTPECIERTKGYEKELADWKAKYPSYCKNCKGWGGSYSNYDPSPAGVSLSAGSMVDVDPCEMCIDNGACPRCGLCGVAPETDPDKPCPHCGWDPADPEGMPGFDRGPCPCEIDADRKAEKTYQREMEESYNSRIRVYCTICKEWIPEKDVKFVDIEEDNLGRDQMTFTCPACGTTTKSLRVG